LTQHHMLSTALPARQKVLLLNPSVEIWMLSTSLYLPSY
jgi:hypothetical protein